MQRNVDDATAERAKAMEEMAPADGPSRLEGERVVEGLKGISVEGEPRMGEARHASEYSCSAVVSFRREAHARGLAV